MIKSGTKWRSANGAIFHVIHRVEVEGKIWIHYLKENAKENENKEFSCYEESFLERFKPEPE